MMNSIELRQAIRAKYAWPGGYEIFFTTTDGALLCNRCVKDHYYEVAWSRRYGVNDGWRVDGAVTEDWLNSESYCDHCGKRIGFELEES